MIYEWFLEFDFSLWKEKWCSAHKIFATHLHMIETLLLIFNSLTIFKLCNSILRVWKACASTMLCQYQISKLWAKATSTGDLLMLIRCWISWHIDPYICSALDMNKRADKLSSKVDNFNATEDGEASKKSQGASNKSKLSFHSHLDITINQCVFLLSFCPSWVSMVTLISRSTLS